MFSIDLPNAQERLESINFHLRKSRENGQFSADLSIANLQQLVDATENFSGADISQIVRMAISAATKKLIRVSALK
jgi:SpoVK/Ycf46/Vps4 family AAA+-type ATPase